VIKENLGRIQDIEVREAGQLNPYLIRLFRCINNTQISHLYAKLLCDLSSYQKYLLKFANINKDLVMSSPFKELGLRDIQV
jgi:hypothetical protein